MGRLINGEQRDKTPALPQYRGQAAAELVERPDKQRDKAPQHLAAAAPRKVGS